MVAVPPGEIVARERDATKAARAGELCACVRACVLACVRARARARAFIAFLSCDFVARFFLCVSLVLSP